MNRIAAIFAMFIATSFAFSEEMKFSDREEPRFEKLQY